jgi:CBS domain-containing protein
MVPKEIIDILSEVRIEEFLKSHSISRYTLHEDSPLILSTVYLNYYNIVYLNIYQIPAITLVDEKSNPTGFITGYHLLHALYTHREKVWEALYKIQLKDVKDELISVDINETVINLIRKLHKEGFLYACVMHEGKSLGTIGYLNLLKFLLNFKELENVNSPYTPNIIYVHPNSKLIEVIFTMLSKRVRRLLVMDINKIISDRSIIRTLFSKYYIEYLRDKPSEILYAPIEEFPSFFENFKFVENEINLYKAINLCLESESNCLIIEDFKGIITPWDLAIKPFVE